MNTQALQQIADQLKKFNSVAIVCGQELTIDGLGSALALSLGLQSLGKTVHVVSKQPARAEHSRLVGINTIVPELGGQKSFVISLPNAVDLIEKVSCYAEGQQLNIVLQPYPDVTEYSPGDLQYARVGGSAEAVVLIDVPNKQEVADILNTIAQAPVFAIGRIGDMSIQQKVIEPEESATSQITFLLMKQMHVQFSADMAANLLQGIYESTNDFHGQNVKPRAFEDAAHLLRIVHNEIGKAYTPVSTQANRQQASEIAGRQQSQQGSLPQNQASRPVARGAQARPSQLPQLPQVQQPDQKAPAMAIAQNAQLPQPQAQVPRQPAQPQRPQPSAMQDQMRRTMAREFEIDDKFEFEDIPDQKVFTDTARPDYGQTIKPAQMTEAEIMAKIAQASRGEVNQSPKEPIDTDSGAILSPYNQESTAFKNQPQGNQNFGGQNRNQNRDGGQNRNQNRNQNRGQDGRQNHNPQVQAQNHSQSPRNNGQQIQQPNTEQPQEEDWLSPKIYKTEDLI